MKIQAFPLGKRCNCLAGRGVLSVDSNARQLLLRRLQIRTRPHGFDTRATHKTMSSAEYIQTIDAFRPTRRVTVLEGATLVVAALVQALPPGLAANLNAEDGPFEIGSALVLGMAALVGMILALRRPSLARIAGAVVLAALVLRELDFQKRFTYRSIESIGFYTRPIAPWWEKAIGLGVLTLVGLALCALAYAAMRRLPQALRSREAWLGSLAAAAGLLASSLVCEKFLGFTVAEEALEMGFGGVILAVVAQTTQLRESVRAPAVARVVCPFRSEPVKSGAGPREEPRRVA